MQKSVESKFCKGPGLNSRDQAQMGPNVGPDGPQGVKIYQNNNRGQILNKKELQSSGRRLVAGQLLDTFFSESDSFVKLEFRVKASQ